MKACLYIPLISMLIAGGTSTSAFTLLTSTNTSTRLSKSKVSLLNALPEKVEVCGNKDCRRAGGGAKLEDLIKSVLEENNLTDQIKVEGCDCQGECGYGPNLLLDGKIVNDVKGKDAVIKALGIESA